MAVAPAPDRALAPYRVLDLTSEVGALCPRLLAGMGADVIRVEPPGGHPLRRRGPFWRGVPHPERSLYWFQMNLGKRGITLNLATADGRALFRRLAATADVVVESLAPGEIERLGLGHAALAAVNPRLVLTSISLYGAGGASQPPPPAAGTEAERHRRAWTQPSADLLGMAAGGLMYLCGDRDRPPVRVTVEQGNAQAGLHAAVATLVAHFARTRTGRGAHVDVSMQESVVWAMANNRLLWPGSGVIPHRAGGGRAGAAGSRLIYAAADGYIGFMRRPEHMGALKRWLDDVGIALDFDIEAWAGMPAVGDGAPPAEQIARLEEVLAAYFVRHTKQELYREGQRRGLVLAEVSTPRDLVESEHLRERGFWQRVAHPELGDTLTYPGAPARLTATPWRADRRPPRIGEHNVEIYCDELGLSRRELAALAGAGVV
jgi:benzylsuccinate CoA-transferase BbsE subunit